MDEMKKYALASVDANAEIYNKISDSIWDDPELSLKEHHAAALYCEALEKLGFTVEKGICGIETAFSGSYGAGRPVIGILGEFDALSGLSQKCGETSLAHKALNCAGKVIASAAIELIDDPALLQKAKDEHAERAAGGYVCPIEKDAVPIAI